MRTLVWSPAALQAVPAVTVALAERHGLVKADFTRRLWWACCEMAGRLPAEGFELAKAAEIAADTFAGVATR